MQNTDSRCGEFGGCRVSSRVSIHALSQILLRSKTENTNGPSGAFLECADVDDCSRQLVRGMHLDVGSYRLFTQLFDRAGREVTGERERAFSVVSTATDIQRDTETDGQRDPRVDSRGWLCDDCSN